LGDRKACKKVGVGLLVLMILLDFARFIDPVVTTTSHILSSKKYRMETFWYWLTQVHQEKWLLKWTERKGER